jgi:hypothetical protein
VNKILTFVLLFTLSPSALAAHDCGSLLLSSNRLSAGAREGSLAPHRPNDDAWTYLRANGLLLEQKEQGECTLVCAFNAVQVASFLAGRTPDTNIRSSFDNFVRNNPTDPDGLDLPHLMKVVRDLLAKRGVNPRANQVSAKVLGRSGGLYSWLGIKSVDSLNMRDLLPEPKKIKIVGVSLVTSKNEYLGGHAIIILGGEGDKITVSEPNAPDVVFTLERKNEMRVNGRFMTPWLFFDSQSKPDERWMSVAPSFVLSIDLTSP